METNYRVIFFKDKELNNSQFMAMDKSDGYFNNHRWELTTYARGLTFHESGEIAHILNQRLTQEKS